VRKKIKKANWSSYQQKKGQLLEKSLALLRVLQ